MRTATSLALPALTLALVLPIGVFPRTAHAVECRSVADSGPRFTVCDVDPLKEDLRVYLTQPSGEVLGSFAALKASLKPQHRQLVFAMNGGMYHKGGKPVGLVIEHGVKRAPLNLSEGFGNFFRKPNGVFLITADRTADIVESDRVPRIQTPIVEATQSGPLLVLSNSINEALPRSIDRYVRNGVGIDARGHALFVMSEDELTLRQFAAIFKDALRCSKALYLDGSVSSLYGPEGRTRGRGKGLGPLIAVTVGADR